MTVFLSPYPGLRPFDLDESHLFFGREEQTDELLRRLRDTHFLAVVGPSGCGKSSLVRAGMISALQSGFMVGAGSRWRFAIIRPGVHPLHNLATALVDQEDLHDDAADRSAHIGVLGATLRRGPLGLVQALRDTPLPDATNLLVLVDQFEEIFRFRRETDSAEADAFVSLLLASTRQRDVAIYVVITMRSDFFGDCAAFTGLPEALNRSQYLTPRLTRDQRRAAIAGPARVFEGDVAPDLVNRLLNEMGTDSDQLPLMQHLLMRMWTWQSPPPPATDAQADANADDEFVFDGAGRVLTIADQDAVGGLRRALSNHADEAFGRLNARQQYIAEVLFRCLSERGPDGRDIRRPTRAADMAMIANASLAELIDVVEVFRAPTCNFVVPPSPEPIDAESVLDITHEALIRQWKRLREWAADEAQLAETYLFLERNAQMWAQGQMAPWGTPNLELALDWRARAEPTPAWAARYGGDFGLAMRFLDASVAARELREAEQRAQRRRQVRRWRNAALASAILALLLAGSVGGYWWMFAKEHVAYYRDFEKRWGEPIGIGPLDAEQVRHRASSLMFVQKGFSWDLRRTTGNLHPTIRVEAVDADGHCTSDNVIGTYLNNVSSETPLHECRIEFIRAAGSDQIVYETAYAKDGSIRWGYNYVGSPAHATERIAYYLGPDGFFAKFPNSLAEVLKFTYSATGSEIRRQYTDHTGRPEPGPDRAYGQISEHDASGRRVTMTSIDASGQLMNDTAGNATLRTEYDEAGDLIRSWALDKDGKPVMLKDGYQRHEYSYDAFGRELTSAHFDDSGHPALDATGIHKTSFTYDEKGRVTAEAFFDSHDKPVVSREGYHRAVATEFGPDGSWRRWAFFGRAGEKATDTKGAHQYVRTYDSLGFVTALLSLDQDGRPVSAQVGCQETRNRYDDNGFVASRACFNGDGTATLDNDGVHRTNYQHDSRGNVIEGAFFGRNGEPISTVDGLHRWTNAYDALGNIEEGAYFGDNDQPVRIATGYAKMLTPHDQRGNLLSGSYLDEHGHLVTGPDGYARIESRYDGRDNAIETAYYDAEGRLTDQSTVAKGYAIRQQAFDDHDRLTETAYLDSDRKPITGTAIIRQHFDGDIEEQRYYDGAGQPVAQPCFLTRAKFDDRWHKMTEYACFDDKAQPTINASGFANETIQYDDHGNLTEVTYFDVNGKALLIPIGYATARMKYDAPGHLTERAYFDADGNLRLQTGGFAIERRQNDERGNVTEWTYFGADGQPIAVTEGYCRAVSRYDEHGKETETSYFGGDGQPVVTTNGHHRATVRYDARGNGIEYAYYGTDEKLLLQSDGYAIERRVNDDHGRTTEQAYFGEAAQPISLPGGYHRTTTRYDDHGKETERTYYGPDGKLAETSDGFAAEKLTYDARGNQTESAIYAADGALIARCAPDPTSGTKPEGCVAPDGRIVHSRAVIVAVVPGGPADRVGIKAGDFLDQYADVPIFSPQDLDAVQGEGTAPRTLVVRRGEQTQVFTVPPGLLGIDLWTKFVPPPPSLQQQ